MQKSRLLKVRGSLQNTMKTYFTDFLEVDPATLAKYGAFNVSLVTDLPLFIDPFLLFNSKKRKYQELHAVIIAYLIFLRDKARTGSLNEGLLKSWYLFPEVKQNWLGFTMTGNGGSGLGRDFANALHDNLHQLFPEFGKEAAKRVTRGSHLEKLCLVREGVGRDNISDFTTNLIKAYLCEYTQEFALKHIAPEKRRKVAIQKARFSFETETWMPETFDLPFTRGDYVLLTPRDILTKDDTWINKHDLIKDFSEIPSSIPDDQLRAQVNNYFASVLVRAKDKEPTKKDAAEAAFKTLRKFPDVVDYYIRMKEESGDQAESISSGKVKQSEQVYVAQIQSFQHVLSKDTAFYLTQGKTYEEAHQRLAYLKDMIENKGCHKIFYIDGKPIQREEDLQIMFRLVWINTESDVSREVNDGRGPADFKISRGAKDKTIVEFKLAKNTGLERNLQKQVEIYQKASDAEYALKAILIFSDEDETRVARILKKLGLTGHKDIVLIDARGDNKPSGSKA
jgi:hypothetical protein